MTAGLSLYLDLLRVMAALQVVLFHIGKVDAAGLGLTPLTLWGHEAVIIFFVLSGFVVSHAAATNDTTFQRYAASRFSRLYSVIIPCLFLTVVCDSIGMRLLPEIYDTAGFSHNGDAPFARLLLTLLMLNESWGSIRFFSNVPFWSLCYEFWYYVIFGIYFYFTGVKRALLLVAAALVASPRVLMLLPIWWLGVCAYAVPVPVSWRRAVLWTGLLQPLVVGGVYAMFDLNQLAVQPTATLGALLGVSFGWSSLVLSDLVLGLSLAVHLVAIKQFDRQVLGFLQRLRPLIRWAAAGSFTLYLLHTPLLFALTALLSPLVEGPLRPVLIVSGTIALPLLMAPLLEGQRHRLRALIERLQFRLWPAVPFARGLT
jgi:peptidoglycan/LPS O-acetylase OafA/YrhL